MVIGTRWEQHSVGRVVFRLHRRVGVCDWHHRLNGIAGVVTRCYCVGTHEGNKPP